MEQAGWVDAQTIQAVVGLPFGRAMAVVEAKIIAVDPEGHEVRRQLAAERRYVSIGRDANGFGLRTLVAQTTAGDVLRFNAMVQHLAGLMAAAGDEDPLNVRRAKALGSWRTQRWRVCCSPRPRRPSTRTTPTTAPLPRIFRAARTSRTG